MTMTTPALDTAERLYEAFAAHDAERLVALLHPDFRGEVTAGLPHDLGGVYEGPESMLRDCWARVFRVLDTRPVPDELVATEDGRVIALGRYRGRGRDSGRPHDAAFVHVLRFRDGRVVELRQITDSRRWAGALGES
jgi:ketosteroid isomerase-like protein